MYVIQCVLWFSLFKDEANNKLAVSQYILIHTFLESTSLTIQCKLSIQKRSKFAQ